jgi:hypothetical protein
MLLFNFFINNSKFEKIAFPENNHIKELFSKLKII